MKRFSYAVLACVSMVFLGAKSADAAVILTYDAPFVTAYLPTTGSATYSLTGTISVDPGTTIDSAGFAYAYSASSVGLNEGFSSGLIAYVSGGDFTSPYHGGLIDFQIPSTQAEGIYAFNYNLTAPSVFGISWEDTSGFHNTSLAYGVVVTTNPCPAPEPAAFTPLGLGVLILVRRRRK